MRMSADASPKPGGKQKPPTTIRDARGQTVAQLDPVELQLLRRHDVIDAEALRPIVEEIGSGLDDRSRRFVPVLAIGAALLALVLIVQIIDEIVHGNPWGWLSPRNVVLGNVWFLVLVFWYRAKQGRFGRIRRIMLKHERCPHCGYDLHALAADPADGATLCPECGCAWKIENATVDSKQG
jgi:hypothetical protein